MNTITVQIDGREVEIAEKKPRANMEWRAAFEAEFGDLAGFLTQTAAGWEDIEFQNAADLVAFVRQSTAHLLPAINQIWPLCVAYDTRFEDAYESECVNAFPALLTLAFPFGGALARLRPYLNESGLLGRSTTTSSPPPNGAGPKPTATPPSTRSTSPATPAASAGKRGSSPSKS